MDAERGSREPNEEHAMDGKRELSRWSVPRSVIVRLGRLLHMEYRPAELAEELDCSVDAVYKSYLSAGCPHRRDETGHIWIVGTEFREWMRATRKKDKITLADGEAYCLKCNAPVKMSGELAVQPVNLYLELVRGECPVCRTQVNRARARKGQAKK